MLDINTVLTYSICDLLGYIETCNLENKKVLLANEKIKAKFINGNSNIFITLINSLDRELLEIFLDKTGIELLLDSKKLLSLEFILNNSFFRNTILNGDYDISQLIFKEINFGEDILKDKRFIEKLVNERDISKYRFMMNSLEKNNNISYLETIENNRKKYYDNIINSYDKSLGMFKKYADIFDSLVVNGKLVEQQILFDLDLGTKLPFGTNYDINIIFFNQNNKEPDKIKQIKEVLHKVTCVEFGEILVDRFYEDITYNFSIDLENLIKFNNEVSVVSKENMIRYLKLFKILHDKNNVDIDFYNSFDKNKNYVEEYYDDFSISRKKSYELINDSLIDFKKIEKQKNSELSLYYGVDVYEFKGESFYMMIHNTSKIKSDPNLANCVFQKYDECDGTSMSLINDSKMDFYGNRISYETIILGFNNLDINNFVHVYNDDSFSAYMKCKGIATYKYNKLYTPNSLINDTNSYNEIVYQVKTDNTKYLSKTLKPSYVVTFDSISEGDIAVAKKFNIPIINIDKSKYQKHNNELDKNNDISDISFDFTNSSSDRYVSSYAELQNKRR